MKRYLTLILVLAATAPARADVTWRLDEANSSVGFRVRHLMISHVPGRFGGVEATVVTMPDGAFEGARIEAIIDVASIDTGNRRRDDHLLDDDFFAAEKHPTIRYVSRSVRRGGAGEYRIEGDLTMRGVTRPLALSATFGGEAVVWGDRRAAFEARGELNRFDYGLRWNQLMDSGGMMVGDTIELVINAELVAESDDAERSDP